MTLEAVTYTATIIGVVSILITLIFLIIELKRNVNHIRTMNIITRDNQYYKFIDYWAAFENIETVIKGSKNYSDLDDKEKFKFEIYIENRIRMFAFSVNTTRTSKTLEFHNNRICDFFQYEGSIECFNELNQRKLLPLNWVKVINDAIKN